MAEITANDVIVQFGQWKCRPVAKHYMDGDRKALALHDIEDGAPVAIATVNLPEKACEEDEVFIKDWTENEGMLSALLQAGIVEEPHRSAATGFVIAPVCKLTEKGKALWDA